MAAKATTSSEHDKWLDEIITLPEAAVLRKVSVDTLRNMGRNGQIKILKLSPRRRGITRREALKGIKEPG
jgi:hypothetical protein